MMPTAFAAAAPSTSSSGLRRNAFRMICTVAVPRRDIAVRASSQVSTLTPYAAMAPSSTKVSRSSYAWSLDSTLAGGQCSWTRSSRSGRRLRRERSTQPRKLARV